MVNVAKQGFREKKLQGNVRGIALPPQAARVVALAVATLAIASGMNAVVGATGILRGPRRVAMTLEA